MKYLTTLLCGCILLPALATAQSGTGSPPGSPPGIQPGNPGGASVGQPGNKPDAKKGKGDEAKDASIVPDAIGFAKSGLLDENGNPKSAGAAARMTAEQARRTAEVLAAGTIALEGGKPRGDHLFTPTAMLRPRRAAPGETGMLHIVVTLMDPYVVLAGSVATANLSPEGSPLRFSSPILKPAPLGTSPKFKGRRVYEETLIFEVPVVVREDATNGSHPVAGTVELALHNGSTGAAEGVFVAEVKGTVMIGKSLGARDKTGVAGSDAGARKLAGEATANAGEGGRELANPTGDSSEERRGATGNALETNGSAERSGDTPAPSHESDDAIGASTILWIAGCGVFALLALLLLRRRR